MRRNGSPRRVPRELFADLDTRVVASDPSRVHRLWRRSAIACGALLASLLATAATGAFDDVPGDVAQDAALNGDFVVNASQGRLLEEIESGAVCYFIEQTDPRTGLTRDRAPKNGGTTAVPASIAATGFALTAWCIADFNGLLPPGEAVRRVRASLRFAVHHAQQVHGWYYHFIDTQTGRRAGGSEVSTIDTALFLQGALFAREYLRDPETTELVGRIYRRIDWPWALNAGTTLTMGWRPESGFLPYRWDSYCESMGLYLLGLGAPVNALAPAVWHAWQRPLQTIEGRTYIHCGPLFTHQYAHAWFDFRGQSDRYADYWQNSVDATLAQRAWSAKQAYRFPHWSDALWGLTASDGPNGYMAWGTPGPGEDESDGTLVPCAPGGSLPFAPAECLTALQGMRVAGGDQVWGRYGFADSFNPETGWVSPDVIGIDLGIMLVMAENLRTGLVWRQFMRAPEVVRGMARAGFRHRESPDNFSVPRTKTPGNARPAHPQHVAAPAPSIKPAGAAQLLPHGPAAAVPDGPLPANLGHADADGEAVAWVRGPDVAARPIPRPAPASGTDEHRNLAVDLPRPRLHLYGVRRAGRRQAGEKSDGRTIRDGGRDHGIEPGPFGLS